MVQLTNYTNLLYIVLISNGTIDELHQSSIYSFISNGTIDELHQSSIYSFN